MCVHVYCEYMCIILCVHVYCVYMCVVCAYVLCCVCSCPLSPVGNVTLFANGSSNTQSCSLSQCVCSPSLMFCLKGIHTHFTLAEGTCEHQLSEKTVGDIQLPMSVELMAGKECPHILYTCQSLSLSTPTHIAGCHCHEGQNCRRQQATDFMCLFSNSQSTQWDLFSGHMFGRHRLMRIMQRLSTGHSRCV